MRRLLALVAVIAGIVALIRRRRGSGERITIAYEDGSSLTLDGSSDDGERLLELARPALSA
jgi:ferric-dicitrate binding protein FerR (iron transport regulator)